MKVINYKGIANQFLIESENGTMFQSYNSNIAFKANDGTITLGKDWNYSKSTGKYRDMFLGESKKEIESKIKAGIYTVNVDL